MKRSEFSLFYRLSAFFFLLVLLTAGSVSAGENSVKEIRGIVYKTVGEQQIQLNLFLPEKDGETLKDLPVLIFIDSGCWYSNGPGNGGFWGLWDCAKEGYAVVSIGHRSLGDGAVFPDQIEDVRAAVRFLRAHAAEYGLDPNRFASMGCSSGGHLSTTLGIPNSISPFEVGDNLDQSGQVNLVVDFYGPTDFTSFVDNIDAGNPSCVYEVFNVKKGESFPHRMSEIRRLAYKASTLNYVTPDFAPTIIFHGVTDPVVPISQSALFYEALRRAGVKSQFIAANTGVHDVGSLGSIDVIRQQIFDFLKDAGF